MNGRRLGQQISDSFLVRCWMEPRELANHSDVVRIYVRNLRTGEEHYLHDASQVGELLDRGLHLASDGEAEGEQRHGCEVG